MNGVNRLLVLGATAIGCAVVAAAGDVVVDGLLVSSGGGVKFPDGSVQTSAAHPRWAQVAIVDADGRGDYTDPVAAMSDWPSWCGSPSDSSPCLVKILPGDYNIGSAILLMQQYIDIEGSGRGVTRIRAASNDAVVQGMGFAELRSLTIINEGVGGSRMGIFIGETPNVFRVTDVSVVVAGDNTNNVGVYCGASQLVMESVDIVVSDGQAASGVVSINCSGTLRNLGVDVLLGDVTEGVAFESGATPLLVNSRVSVLGGFVGRGIRAQGVDASIRGVTVTVDGATTGAGLQSYDAALLFTDGEVQVRGGTTAIGLSSGGSGAAYLRNVRIEVAEGSSENAGAWLTSSGAQRLEDVSISATGGSESFVVSNSANTPTTLLGVIGRASGASVYNYGLYNRNGATIEGTDLDIVASGGAGSYAALNGSDGGVVSIDRSSLSGGSASARNDNAAVDMFVGASKLEGPVTSNLACFGNYDASYGAVTCP